MSKLQDVRARLEDYRKNKLLSGSILSDTISSTDFQSVEGSTPTLNNTNDQDAALEAVKKSDKETGQEYSRFYWLILFLKIAVWLLLWAFFISVEFGLVYFVCSCLFMIVISMRGGKKRRSGTLSAYSVFNKNFEVIDGTFTAEQLERELRQGPNSVR